MSPFPTAPLFTGLALGPEGGSAYWLTTRDGVRIRAAVWPEGQSGTVLLFSGRTEYVEKYGVAAGDLRARGYATVVFDWRGQGLADRLLPDPMIGHVGEYQDYQHDVQAVLDMVDRLALPQPLYLLSHSMGGAIALRALANGIAVKAAVFSAPMWGISMAAWLRPFAGVITQIAKRLGQDQRRTPGTTQDCYVLATDFVDNVLTKDPEMWAYMKRQVTEQPGLQLAGPSLAWLNTALIECHALSLLPAPAYPVLTTLGTAEKVVDSAAVHRRMAGWPGGRLEMFDHAEHEVMMEIPAHRERFFNLTAEFFGQHR
ncbi:MAG: alpha/beta hydrolase [Rhodobacteraceae bacterium]|nr:alpha/beta hydrolase [Paracoccaceae bacterium]